MEPFEPKDPDSRVPRWFDWSEYAADRNTSVIGYELEIENATDASLEIHDAARSGDRISFWLEGGTLDATYVIRCRATFANGGRDDYSRTQTIAER